MRGPYWKAIHAGCSAPVFLEGMAALGAAAGLRFNSWSYPMAINWFNGGPPAPALALVEGLTAGEAVDPDQYGRLASRLCRLFEVIGVRPPGDAARSAQRVRQGR